MSAKKTTKNEGVAILGVGVAACAACCAGPIIGVLAAIGVGTAVAAALLGSIVMLFGALVFAFVVARRRRSVRQTPMRPRDRAQRSILVVSAEPRHGPR
jgi:hypothetical protein